MADPVSATAGTAGPSAAYKTQIEALKADPNATAAYKQQLDQWLQQLETASGGGTQDPGAAQPGAAQPGAGHAGAAPAGAARDGGPPQGGPAASGPAGSGTAGTPNPAGVPAASTPQPGAAGGKIPAELKSLAPAIQAASVQTGMSLTEISAIIWDESRGKAGASSTNGGNGQTDAGLMQINPATFGELQSKHKELQGKPLSDPATNILAGSYLLADFKQQFGSIELAERAFNSGAGSVDKSNPNMTTTGLGDPGYIQKVAAIKADIERGTPLPA